MAFTKAQLEALKNSLLASNQPILASQHRQQIQSIIDEMYDAQSRANILVGVQSDSVQGGSDTFLVFRSGQAYQLPVSLLNANELASLGDVFINNLEDGDSLVYDAVANRWENRSILLGFELSNLTDVQLSSLAGGDILRYNSTSSKWENVSLASLLAPYALLTDLDAYQLLSAKGQPNGYASLDGGGKVPANQLPSFVDDVLEFPSLGDFPTTGETGKIYVALDTNKTYRWSGSAYVEISPSDVNSVFGRTGVVTAQVGDYASFYVTLNTAQTITGSKIFSLDTTINGIQIGRGAGNSPDNTRIGFNALSSNTTGSNNTASGYEALLSNTNGNSNTANGFSAGRSNTSGSNNVYIGNQSLVGNTTGNLNTAIGNNAGRFIADGITPNTITNNSVFLGANSRSLGNNESNQIVIGHNAIGKGSNTVTIGNTSTVSTHLAGNIHASKSTTNEAIINYSNTAVRTYTLPDASGTIALTSDLNAYLPLTGGTVASSGSTNTLNIDHASGSGIALNITKGGNGEALTVVKTSGLGLVASFTGGETLISELQTTTKIADQYIESAITWNAKIGGTISSGQVAFGTGTGVIGGDNGLFWDNVNKRLGVGISSPTSAIHLVKSSNSGSGQFFPQITLTNTLTTQGDGSSTFNFSGVVLNSGDGAVTGVISTSFATGVWEPQLLINATTNNPIIFRTNNIERWRITNVGILQSNGAQTIQTSTGNLTLATAGGNGNILLTPNGSGNVGIGTSSPSYKLQINGSLNIPSGSPIDIGTSTNSILRIISGSGVNFIQSAINNTSGGSSAPLVFGSMFGVNEWMRITSTGNVGIGTSNPSDKLEIGGAGAGIILASPDGTRYRVTVTDLGVLTVAAV